MSTAVSEPLTRTPADASANANDGAQTSQIVSFRLANEEYGVDIMNVQEIILMGQITTMPEVPDFICGLINLRGNVIPIVDLRKRFELPVAKATEDTRIIVVNVGDKTIGMVVDAVNEVLRITPDQMEPPPSSIASIDHAYIIGLIKFDQKLLIMLNIERILSNEEQEKIASLGA